MFDLNPISNTNLISIAQALIVIVSFYFSWRSLKGTITKVNAVLIQADNRLVATIRLGDAAIVGRPSRMPEHSRRSAPVSRSIIWLIGARMERGR